MIRSLLIVLVLFLVWFVNNSFNDVPNENNQVTEILGLDGVPDYYSENFKLQQFNEQGVMQSVINTDRLLHYPDQQQAFLESPEITLYGTEGDIWKITSVTGSITDNNSNVTLTDDVVLLLHSKTIPVGMLAFEALKVMEDNKINGLIIVDENEKPVGAINMYDLLKAGVV